MSTPANASTQQLIDRVVREVLARLTRERSERSADNRPGVGLTGKPEESDGHCFSFAERVISVDSLAEVPADAARVLVENSTVITPAARDLARQRGIVWVRQGETPLQARDVLLIADTDSSARAAGLSHQLASRGLTATPTDADALLKQVQDGRASGIALSDLPAGFVCMACRNESIRAATISELNELNPIASQMQPNLWVIDMRRVTLSKAIVLAERCIRLFPQGATS